MPKEILIGREKEVALLKQVSESYKSEFVALYGRRRVGKTFLVKELFSHRYTFQLTGLSNTSTKGQLKNFYANLLRFDPTVVEKEMPES